MKDSATADVIHEAMRKAVPADQLDARKQWRDDRLAVSKIQRLSQTLMLNHYI